MRNVAKVGLILLVAGAPMGCIVIKLTGQGYARAPDPQEDCFIKVSKVSARELALGDGRKLQLLGVDVSGLTEKQLKAFETVVATITVGRPRLVLAELRGDKARIEESYYRPPQAGALVITVFPQRVEVPPTRIDVGQRIIAGGYARAKPDEIEDLKLRAWYAASEERAKAAGLGVWGRCSPAHH